MNDLVEPAALDAALRSIEAAALKRHNRIAGERYYVDEGWMTWGKWLAVGCDSCRRALIHCSAVPRWL